MAVSRYAQSSAKRHTGRLPAWQHVDLTENATIDARRCKVNAPSRGTRSR